MDRIVEHYAATGDLIVACVPSMPDEAYGWTCAGRSPSILHYVYVKTVWRTKGVGRALVAAAGFGAGAPLVCSHMTPAFRKAFCERPTKRPFELINPYSRKRAA